MAFQWDFRKEMEIQLAIGRIKDNLHSSLENISGFKDTCNSYYVAGENPYHEWAEELDKSIFVLLQSVVLIEKEAEERFRKI